MSIPDVEVEVQDGALGLAGADTDNIHVKMGVASAGPVNTLLSFTDKKQVQEVLGSGPLAEALAVSLTRVRPVYAMRVTASTAGSAGAVTKTGTGTGTVTVAGTPRDAYEVTVVITRTGEEIADGTAAFTYTLDGGDVVSPEIAIPSSGTYVLPGTGLTLAFANGVSGTSFVAGDTHAFTTTAPAATLSDLNDAFDALLADPREWGFVHVVGTSTPTVAAAVASRMAEAETRYRYGYAVLEARDQADNETEDEWMSALISEWADFADRRVEIVAGYGEIVSQLTGRVHRRSDAWVTTARVAAIPVHEHPGRVASGPVGGLTKLYHDEDAKPGLDERGFTTMRTIIGRQGFWVTNGRIMAPSGSDFQFTPERRVMDKACKISRNAFLQFLNDNVRITETGLINEADARAIEAYVDGSLASSLLAEGNASGASVQLKRDSNVLSTRSTTLTVRVVPVGYLSHLTIDIGFRNPALEPAAS